MSCTEFSVLPVFRQNGERWIGRKKDGENNIIHLLILMYCCVHVHLQSFFEAFFYESHIASVHECFSSFNTKKNTRFISYRMRVFVFLLEWSIPGAGRHTKRVEDKRIVQGAQ